MGGLQLEIRAGGASGKATPGSRLELACESDATLTLLVSGATPRGAVVVSIGGEREEARADAGGALEIYAPDALRARAGILEISASTGSAGTAEAALIVFPRKLDAAALRILLDDLSALTPRLIEDGHGPTKVLGSIDVERALGLLENAVASANDAAPWIRHRPIGHRSEEVAAIAAERASLSSRDVLWLVRHPQRSMRAASSGREVTVRRTKRLDLDVPENRGVAGLFAALRVHLAKIDAARGRIATAREDRRFWTDLLGERGDGEGAASWDDRVSALRDELEAAWILTALPSGLRPLRQIPRTPAVETHPGYWRLYQLSREVAAIDELVLPAPWRLRSLDALYEAWCALQLATALGHELGCTPETLLSTHLRGDRLVLGSGRAIRRGGASLRLLHPLDVPPPGEARPGWPYVRTRASSLTLRPDFALEVRRGDAPPALHVFDAKHRLDPERPLRDLFYRYGEGIALAGTVPLPAVRSVWILHPGPDATLVSPAMRAKEWPAERLRGGALPLRPGAPGDAVELRALLRDLLDTGERSG